MKHLLVAAALLASTGVAAARPAPMPRPLLLQQHRVHGGTLLEIRHRSEVAAPTDTIRVTNTGMVLTVKRDQQGHVIERETDRLSKRELRQVRRALNDATWDVTYSKIRCFAYSPSYTEYVVHGDVKLRAQMCSGAAPDEATSTAIGTIEAILAR